MDINKEKNDIEEILKGHKPKLIEKDFYDLLLNEDIGRFMDESPEKDIHVTIKVPMDELLQIKGAIEKVNQGKVHDLPLLATSVVEELIRRYFSEEYIAPEDFIDLTVREEVDETILATSGEPTDNTDVTPIKDETVLSTANMPNTIDQPRTMKEEGSNPSLRNASYYRWGKYKEDLPLDVKEIEDMQILTADEQLTLDMRDEDVGKTFYAYRDEIDTDETGTSIKNAYAIKGEK